MELERISLGTLDFIYKDKEMKNLIKITNFLNIEFMDVYSGEGIKYFEGYITLEEESDDFDDYIYYSVNLYVDLKQVSIQRIVDISREITKALIKKTSNKSSLEYYENQ